MNWVAYYGLFKGNQTQKLLMRENGSPPENWAISMKALYR